MTSFSLLCSGHECGILGEDDCGIWQNHAPENMAGFRKIALSLPPLPPVAVTLDWRKTVAHATLGYQLLQFFLNLARIQAVMARRFDSRLGGGLG